MTRAAILALLVLAGCTTDTIPVDRETVAAHELTDIPWPWCTADQLLKCPYIRQGDELLMLGPGERIGDGTSFGGDVWTVRGATVEAFSEDE